MSAPVKKAAAPAAPAAPALRQSIYETRYHAFSPALIEAARAAEIDMTPQLERLNKIAVLCAGMAVVVRIVANNTVVEDVYDPANGKSQVPLGANSIGHLESMVIGLCEHIADDINRAADNLESRVSA